MVKRKLSSMTLDYAIKYLRESANDDYLESMLCESIEYGAQSERLRIAKEKEQILKWLEELSKYRSLANTGRLLKLPCKLRDAIDVIFSHNEIVTIMYDKMCEDGVRRYVHIWHGMAWDIPQEYLDMWFVKVHGVVSDKPDMLYIEVCDR